MSLELEHLSTFGPVGRFAAVPQPARGKPYGTWWSRPRQWLEWARYTDYWATRASLPPSRAARSPWRAGSDKIAVVDMANVAEVREFVRRYPAPGTQRSVDWSAVQRDFAGVFFDRVSESMGALPPAFAGEDGGWALSIDVDSVCVWNPEALGVAGMHVPRWTGVARSGVFTPLRKQPPRRAKAIRV